MTDEELNVMEATAQKIIQELDGETYMDAYGPEVAVNPCVDVLKLVAEVRRLQNELERCEYVLGEVSSS